MTIRGIGRMRSKSASSSPVEAVTWDAAAIGGPGVLSNGNLTITTDDYDLWTNAKSTTSIVGSPRYFEATVSSTGESVGGVAVGVADAAWDSTDGSLEMTDGTAWRINGVGFVEGPAHSGNLNTGLVTPSGGTIRVAVNNGKVWFGNADGWIGDPAAGTGASFTFDPSTELVAATSIFTYPDGTEAVITINFGGSAFAYAVPAGFSAWQS